MIRVLGTAFAALMGLAFGSFLNVCLTRWPAGESIVRPRSHCRNCGRTLAWWENVPLVSWLALRGRCRTCGTWIGWRYVIVEIGVGALWTISVWQALDPTLYPESQAVFYYNAVALVVGGLTLSWMLVALAVLDAENLWLPDWLTLPGVALGFFFVVLHGTLGAAMPIVGKSGSMRYAAKQTALNSTLGILAAAVLILLIRWIYKLIRHREGLGLGDAKLMAMLAAWLGLSGALLSFAIGVVLGSLAAIVLLVRRTEPATAETWATAKLPLGTFLCIGGIVSSLWGQPIIAAYMRWGGF
ncbi:MAG: prepilin peptidase [Terracidiphilus sp.]